MNASRLTDVTRRYRGTTALDAVSLTLEPGRTYGLLGPNGAGKTTAIRILLGLLRPDAGTVQLLGGPPDLPHRTRVGYVPEVRALPMTAQVQDTLVFAARMRGSSRTEAVRRASVWVERLELGHRRGARIDTLSNGEQQKVQLALAFLGEPDLLVLDEPLTALDPAHQEVVLTIVRERVRQGAAVLLATHRLWEAEAVVEHVFLLNHGRKVMDAPLAEALAGTHDDRYRLVVEGSAAWLAGEGVAIEQDEPGGIVFRCEALAPVLARAAAADAKILRLAVETPSLHELFLAEIGE